MREIRTLRSMSGDRKRSHWRGLRHRHRAKAAGQQQPPRPNATAPLLDSTIASIVDDDDAPTAKSVKGHSRLPGHSQTDG